MKTVLLLLTAAAMLSADTLVFVGPTSGQNNGIYFVGPDNLLLNGESIEGVCTSWNIEVAATWQATQVPLYDFSGALLQDYSEAALLTAEFAKNSDWVGIQQAIWDVFGASYEDVDTLKWLTWAVNNAAGTDLTGYYVEIASPSTPSQNELIHLDPPAPEPAMWLPTMIGLGLIGIGWRRSGQRR